MKTDTISRAERERAASLRAERRLHQPADRCKKHPEVEPAGTFQVSDGQVGHHAHTVVLCTACLRTYRRKLGIAPLKVA